MVEWQVMLYRADTCTVSCEEVSRRHAVDTPTHISGRVAAGSVLSSQMHRCTCVGLIEGRINSWLVVGIRHCTQVQLRKTDVQARVLPPTAGCVES
jgi:hypothetical protein